MFEYEAEIVVARSQEDVFDFVTRPENIPQWVPAAVAARQTTAGPFSTGTMITETLRTPLGQSEVKWQVTVYEPHEKCTYAGQSFLGTTRVSFTLSATDDGTLLSVHGTGQLRCLFRLLEPILERVALRDRKRLLLRIKELLEAQEPGPKS